MTTEVPNQLNDSLHVSSSSSPLDSFPPELQHHKPTYNSESEGLSTEPDSCQSQTMLSMSIAEVPSLLTISDATTSMSSASPVTRPVTAISPGNASAKPVISRPSTSSITAALYPSGLALHLNPPLSSATFSQAIVHSHSSDSRIAYVSSSTNTVPEFLYQLTKMLTDDNREIIEWANGKIEVHSPYKLESEVLKKYFRHSKFASFQRQLNYFGFRKQAGKGKMAPCSYVNEAAGTDVHSLLHIKRKSSVLPMEQENTHKKTKGDANLSGVSKVHASSNIEQPKANPVLVGIFKRSRESIAPAIVQGNESKNLPDMHAHELARTAVGRGIRHSFVTNSQTTGNLADNSTASNLIHASVEQTQNGVISNLSKESSLAQTAKMDSLSQLANNFRNSLMQSAECSDFLDGTEPTPLSEMYRTGPIQSSDNNNCYTGFLSKNSSLVDLAMIAPVEDAISSQLLSSPENFEFIDFPI